MKFGMFIHWGIYSELGAGEWVMHERKIPYDNYKRLANFFRPEDFNAKVMGRPGKSCRYEIHYYYLPPSRWL